MDQTTRTLTKAVASGDAEALSRFYDKYFDDLYRMARHATKRDESFCLDVVQDAMMKVIRAIPVLDTESALRAWLRRAVYSCAIDRLRIEARQMKAERSAAQSSHRKADRNLTEVDKQLQWLNQQIAELDESGRTMLIMRHRFGWTLSQIGREFGLSPSAVDGRLSRLIQRLRHKATGGGHGE